MGEKIYNEILEYVKEILKNMKKTKHCLYAGFECIDVLCMFPGMGGIDALCSKYDNCSEYTEGTRDIEDGFNYGMPPKPKIIIKDGKIKIVNG